MSFDRIKISISSPESPESPESPKSLESPKSPESSESPLNEEEDRIILNKKKERDFENATVENQESSISRPTERSSNFELLRIFSMLFIISHHFSVHGGFEFSSEEITLNRLWIQFMYMGGKINVNIFILISGFFLVNSKKLKLSKVLKLELQLITYSIIDFIIGIITNVKPFSFSNLVEHFFPVITNYWWFSTNYIFLYLFFPLINTLINNLRKKTYRNYLIFMITIWSIIPTLYGSTSNQCNYLIWFGFLYFLAGYIRKYPIVERNIKSYIWFFFGVLSYLFTFSSAPFCDILGMYSPSLTKYYDHFFGWEKFPALLTSVLIFIVFSKMNFTSRFINLIASSTFGIYLLHDGLYMREFIWKKFLMVSNYKDNYLLIPYSMAVVLGVFTIGSIIELIRIYLFEKYYMKIIDFFLK
ncbi:hypothetical protein BCR32DRAFT_306895 [Anaeromyces robustus]|uniref:Acyltransferase 3 domain-containing protein n=1 Tax=Anaeromyces robustus TaxID=1754192 RepID=A0A1Y1VSP0_9FUNG|nr:hypothetical protein BCR32DRAFT_306895 [Anaeromyces robustus]|eukprot:ORX64311.1 hypothetical protein BCR32DRAFT_306895 [Anaeromyces robustus]